MSARDDIPDRQIAQLRVPPHSVEAESSLLGGLLLNNGLMDSIGEIPAGDFYRHEHRLVYEAIAKLLQAGKPADAITVHDRLVESGKAQEVGGLAYLASLAQYAPSAASVRHYANTIRERALLRRLISAADEIAVEAFNASGDVRDVVDRAQQKVLALTDDSGRSDDWVGVYEGMLEHSTLLERRHSGEIEAWPTGLDAVDEYLEGGLRPGELVIVGARPSMGKTALGLTIAVHMAQTRPVAFLSMEMSQSEVRDRLTAMLGNVTMSSVKRPRRGVGLAWDRVLEGVDRAKHLQLRINDQGGLNINQVRTKARNAKRKGGLDVLVVDYIGLMSGLDAKANRNAQLGEISRGLKTLAKELQVCVLCLAQLNRAAEERPDAMPQMRDLRDSGEIEQDADVILFIKRPVMNNPDLGPDFEHYAKLSVAKNRQGRCGYLDLTYIGEQTRFSSWSGPAPVKRGAAKQQERGMA